jgi:RNA polymerase sigma-70 factor (ECF subfamily)
MLNTVRSYWRTRGRKPEAMSLDAEDPDGNPTFDPPADTDDPVEGVMRADRIEIVRRAIGELEEEMREVIVLRDIQGLSYEELADSLGLPIGTVKSRLFRARGMLKSKVAPVLQEES